jgi:hypothetical protein
MDWSELAHDKDRWWTLVNAVMNLRVPYSAGHFLACCKPVSFSRRTVLHEDNNHQIDLQGGVKNANKTYFMLQKFF